MKCPLCKDDVDRNLAQMETHLKEVHHLDENDLEQFGGDFSTRVQAQIEIERRGRARARQFDLVLIFIGFILGFYMAFLVWVVTTPA